MLIIIIPRAPTRVNNKRALFEVRSPIKTTRVPHSGLGKLLTHIGYNSGLT